MVSVEVKQGAVGVQYVRDGEEGWIMAVKSKKKERRVV